MRPSLPQSSWLRMHLPVQVMWVWLHLPLLLFQLWLEALHQDASERASLLARPPAKATYEGGAEKDGGGEKAEGHGTKPDRDVN